MNRPDADLMQAYGTERLFEEKMAGSAMPLAARLAYGVLQYGSARYDRAEAREQRIQAELMNEALRELESIQLAQATQGLRHSRAPVFVAPMIHRGRGMGLDSDMPVGMTDGMVRLASVAAEAGSDMAKQAGIGDLLMGAMKGVRQSGSGFGATKRMLQAGAQMGIKPPAAPGLAQKAVQAVSPTARMQSAYKNTPTEAFKAPAPKPAPRAASQLQATQGNPSPTPAAAPSAPAAQGPGTFERLQNDLGGGKWKYKLPMLAAAGLGTYGAVKGLQSGLNWLSHESAPYSFNKGGPQLAYGVNQHGYPQLGTPT